MVTSQYGLWHNFCRDSGSVRPTIPVCNLFNESPTRNGNGYGGCPLNGITLSGDDRHLANLGSIIFSAIAILVTLFLLFKSERKRAAVGRREIQLFLLGYALISLCEIFTVGNFPLDGKVVRGFSAIHIAAVTVTAWILLLNGAVGYQIVEDGTAVSLGLIAFSSVIIFIGTGYIALDTGFSLTSYWADDMTLNDPNRAYALYTLFLLVPLVFIALFFCLEIFLVLRVLQEFTPLIYLSAAAILFAIGQIFQFVISVHICNSTGGKINGGMFEVLFTLLSVVAIWAFWSSITEDDWPTPGYA
ncbi:hypothetical protein BT63DRAFT_187339 [Microthyrium microscopicum]|uniref:Uncharacterized protein n=1 Tax=Microthyrium microscopicum TaxID=703497 RepID=A0A6A6UIP8_9PEZI|nr:hypothetical protein BT63DRAFT_187339 [Microthyrium microscopicum]